MPAMILKTSEDIKVKSGLLKITMLTVWTAMMPGLASCVQEAVVYDYVVAEIGFSPVAGMASKALPGAVDGPDDSDFNYETIGIFAYHKITGTSQNWEDFYNASDAGSLVTYIDGEPFAKPANGNYWAGGANAIDIEITRNGRVLTANVSAPADEYRHMPKYWPKTGYLAFAGYSPYYKLEISKDNDGELTYGTSTPLSDVKYIVDEHHPHLSIEGFEQGRFVWEKDDHWATNETLDLMWFDVNDQNTANSLTTPGIGASESAVPVKFNHACAWLDFNFRAKDETADGKFVILKAELSNVYWKGDFSSDMAEGESAPESPGWTKLDGLRNITLYYNIGSGDSSSEGDWGEKFNFITLDDYFRIGGMMTIPQNISKTVGGASMHSVLTVYYKQLTSDTAYEAAEDKYYKGTKEYDETSTLYSGTPLTEVFTYSFDGQARWEMGKHYVYDIVFGLNEIRVSPSVTEWDDVQTSVPVQ